MRRAAHATHGSPTGHGDLTASLVLIFPLLIAYEIGVLFAGHVNGADLITRAVYAAVGGRTLYLALYVAIAVGFVWWIRRGRHWATLRIEVVAPVVLEAAIYALTLGAVGAVIVERLLGLGLSASSVVSALGAGVHEELVFRLGLITGLIVVFTRSAMDRRFVLVAALALSSLAFAAAHHVGAHGESFTAHAFAFRSVAGIAFGLIYWHRSLAHAVYAHVLYDILVAAS
ncbi:MAG: CPBP family glutamic-type intramembrane protease [Kofleriaceae bacterium]